MEENKMIKITKKALTKLQGSMEQDNTGSLRVYISGIG
jgi:hypothetical protein